MNSRHLVVSLYVAILAVVGLASGTFFFDARAEYRELRKTEAVLQKKLEEKRAQLKAQQRILERLKSDRGFVEKTIRLRLGYARSGDVMFRFPPED